MYIHAFDKNKPIWQEFLIMPEDLMIAAKMSVKLLLRLENSLWLKNIPQNKQQKNGQERRECVTGAYHYG